MNLDIVILAAGRGTRMNSNIPKVLHQIGGDSLLGHVISTASQLESEQIHIVVGYGAEQIKSEFSSQNELRWALQEQQLGTGHAVMQAMPSIDITKPEKRVLVLYGDVPLTSFSTLSKLVQQANENTLCLLTLVTENPIRLKIIH